jgi:4-amino-4-deoxy-L-arabinose transferase-like glycosyltransferase
MKQTLPRILIGLLLVSLVSYIWWNTSALRSGPRITINTPQEFSTVGQVVEVTGSVPHSKEVTINGKSITFTTRGEFRERVVLSPPVDSLDIVAEDAYGKIATKSIQLMVK